MVNLLPFEPGERLNAVLTTRDYPEDQYLIFATKSGTVKKTPLSEYSRPRSIGIIAINLREDDELVDVARTDGSRDIMLFSDAGKAVRFNENSVRSMGRDSTGVRGMNLDDGQRVIALCVVEEQGDILTITENGYGKRRPRSPTYPQKGRGTKGRHLHCVQRTQRPGRLRRTSPGRRTHHARYRQRHPGTHPRRRNLDQRPQHPGRAPHPHH